MNKESELEITVVKETRTRGARKTFQSSCIRKILPANKKKPCSKLIPLTTATGENSVCSLVPNFNENSVAKTLSPNIFEEIGKLKSKGSLTVSETPISGSTKAKEGDLGPTIFMSPYPDLKENSIASGQKRKQPICCGQPKDLIKIAPKKALIDKNATKYSQIPSKDAKQQMKLRYHDGMEQYSKQRKEKSSRSFTSTVVENTLILPKGNTRIIKVQRKDNDAEPKESSVQNEIVQNECEKKLTTNLPDVYFKLVKEKVSENFTDSMTSLQNTLTTELLTMQQQKDVLIKDQFKTAEQLNHKDSHLKIKLPAIGTEEHGNHCGDQGDINQGKNKIQDFNSRLDALSHHLLALKRTIPEGCEWSGLEGALLIWEVELVMCIEAVKRMKVAISDSLKTEEQDRKSC